MTADKFFMYAIRYGSHNVNPKQCEPAYQVGWYLEIVWALYNEDKTYIGHTEALYDIGGVAARYPAHCADTTEGVQNLLFYKHRPPEVFAMRHQYTRAEIEQMPKEHPVWIEGVGLETAPVGRLGGRYSHPQRPPVPQA